MTFKQYHRRYTDPQWDYKAISTVIDKKFEVIYYTYFNKYQLTTGIEVYKGENYDIESTERSYSRHYKIGDIPNKYLEVVHKLIIQHHKTKWSTEKRVDLN